MAHTLAWSLKSELDDYHSDSCELREASSCIQMIVAKVRSAFTFNRATSSLFMYPEAITDVRGVWLRELIIYLSPFFPTTMENIYHS